MGAGQIGGIATLLDIDFDNPAGFIGRKAEPTEGQHIVAYLSHAMMFCVGALIEAHVVLTPASCVIGERYKFDVFGGTHRFLEGAGVSRQVHHLCIHAGYNQTNRWESCSSDNLALLILNHQFSFNVREPGADFIINRLRYGVPAIHNLQREQSCRYYGWGSRRNGYLIPMLIDLRRVDIKILPKEKCPDMWNNNGAYLCIQQPQCRDDVGSVISCHGFAQGMMTSRLVDRPCGVGFVDLTQHSKFLTCAVDDSRDVIDHEEHSAVEYVQRSTPQLITDTHTFTTPVPVEESAVEESPQERDASETGREERT